MQRVKNALVPTLIVLLAIAIVTTMLWAVSKSGIADSIRKGLGGEIAASTINTATAGTTAPASPQENIRSIASFVKVTLLGFLKVAVLMGIPGIFTALVITGIKQNNRQSDEV